MSRARLKELGIELPLFPTTSVGSFPKPDAVRKARRKFDKGEITREDLHAVETEATLFWMRTQEELGIDILVDGEMYRGDMVAYFAEEMGGFEQSGLVRSYGNRYYRKPIITGPIEWKSQMTVERWSWAQQQTKKPVKGMLTGPYTIMDWSFDEHYPNRRDCAMAIARELRKEVEALIEAGCKIVQVDEPALSVRPEELPMAYEAVEVVTKDLPAYFINHVCYGEFEKIYPDMLRMPVHNLDLEMSNSDLDMLALFKKTPFTKDISFGLTDVHSHRIDDVAAVRERLSRAAQVIPPEQIWADPDCGLKTRSVEEAIGQLRVVAEAAASLR